ncbi:DUF5706 domain-containing protein [Candidatus Pacearchaeota archaeon]|nr:DUF5706 domain-containing protein [Candidatus Pacearchaeota archaeon]
MKKGVDFETQKDFAMYVSNHIQDQIELADRKTAWILSIIAVGTGGLLSKTSGINWSEVNTFQVMSILSIVSTLIIIATIQLVSVIYPKISKGNKKGFSYFEDIIQNKRDQYTKKGSELSEKEIVETLYRESYDLASIASRKFRKLHYGIILTVLALISVILSILII